MKKNFLVEFCLIIFIANAHAYNYEYPELQVRPLASERISLEAKNETEKRGATYYSLWAPGIFTFLAGVSLNNHIDKRNLSDRKVPVFVQLVGLTQISLGLGLSFFYQPYQLADDVIKNMPAESADQMLIKERMAEEQIYALKRFERKIKWTSAIIGAGVSAWSFNTANNGSSAKVISFISGLANLVPIFYFDYFSQVDNQQKKYKRSILSLNDMQVFPLLGQMYMPNGKIDTSHGLGLTASF